MVAILELSSLKNPRVKQIADLRHRASRRATGVTRVEGFFEIDFTLAAGAEPHDLYFCPALVEPDQRRSLVEERGSSFRQIISVTEPVFAKMAYREGTDGWLATFGLPHRSLGEMHVPDRALVLVCEGVEKPGNLGAMLRTADAAGVDLVIAADCITDFGNPNVVRASKGTVFTVPFVECSSPDAIRWLSDRAIATVVTTPHTDVMLDSADLTGPIAVVVGAEDVGASDAWMSSAELRIRIPMYGRIDSLNVSTSAALVLYEAIRQRNAV